MLFKEHNTGSDRIFIYFTCDLWKNSLSYFLESFMVNLIKKASIIGKPESELSIFNGLFSDLKKRYRTNKLLNNIDTFFDKFNVK